MVIYQNRAAHNSNRATTHSSTVLGKNSLQHRDSNKNSSKSNNFYELDAASGGAATSGNMRLETIAAGATTSKGWTHEQQLLRAGHNIRRSSNYWQHEAGDDSSRSNNF
jgi:hypothetical protein